MLPETTTEPVPVREKLTGAGHMIAACFYSFGGARRMIEETAFRHELAAAAIVALAFLAADVPAYAYPVPHRFAAGTLTMGRIWTVTVMV